MSRAWVESALARGGIAVGAFDGATLVAYLWFTLSVAPHYLDELWVKVTRPYRYAFKAFTRPEYRGTRINTAVSFFSDAYFLKRGYTKAIYCVEMSNISSLRAAKNKGDESIGFAAYVKWFGRYITFRTPMVMRTGFECFLFWGDRLTYCPAALGKHTPRFGGVCVCARPLLELRLRVSAQRGDGNSTCRMVNYATTEKKPERDSQDQMGRQAVEALLFDLGGVIIDIDFNRALHHWATISSLSFEELRGAFRFDPPYQQHERGELSSKLYFDSLRNSLKLHGSDEQIAAGWNSIFVGEISETVMAVQQVRAKYPCYVFTNSNAAHRAVWRSKFSTVMAVFDHVFVSCEIGLRKPERAAFEYIAHSIGVPVNAILFFDDSTENVTGAVDAGLQAVHVQSPADVQAALLRLERAL